MNLRTGLEAFEEMGAADRVGRRHRRRRGQRHVAAGAGRRVGQAGPPPLAGRRGQRARRRRGGRRRASGCSTPSTWRPGFSEVGAAFEPDAERARALRRAATRCSSTPTAAGAPLRCALSRGGHLALVRERRRRPGRRAARRRARRRASGDPAHDPPLPSRWPTPSAGSPASAPITAEHLDLAPRLRVIARFGTGVDAVDLRAAAERGVVVARTPGANAESVADHAVALMLAALRDLVAGDAAARAGEWRAPAAGASSARSPSASSGSARSAAASPAGWATASAPACWPTTRSRSTERQPSDLEELAREADVISLHLPGGDDRWSTQRFSRGSSPARCWSTPPAAALLDEDAVARALHDGTLAAAAVDVLATEPAPRARCCRPRTSPSPRTSPPRPPRRSTAWAPRRPPRSLRVLRGDRALNPVEAPLMRRPRTAARRPASSPCIRAPRSRTA